MPISNTKTLAQVLSGGRLSEGDAFRYAMQLGDALRRIHDAGQYHGALTPAHVALSASGADLRPAEDAIVAGPYTAPEVLQGQAGDSRSDVFAFGAILFELMTGRRAFEPDVRAALGGAAPTTGNPAADRVIAPCLVRNPDARPPRMRKILMELKLLSVAARRAEGAPSTVSLHREPGLEAAALRNEMQQMESRIVARMSKHERSMAEMQRQATEAIATLKEQVFALG